ncbi:RrF2 family transcriptional regulator [Pannonibacter phragmitetus]|uniref:Rrf2 family transcriptional regulator n=1 Tax=Pannonibacter phragmitetus TaxID=121719 RepID=A0A0U3NAN0_9HYPH|nr:Rrf2 family transcriptional regulator [Pannonibacter phragmitetus]ALV28411.1 Rrf2 family transcriptional regulator [Pannonibacter phragmitetus]
MLSMKGKYGLKAMCHLAGLPEGQVVQSSEIADVNSISKKFLDAILADLRHAGFVHARKGRGGGYCLTRPAEDIMVGHVLRVLDGPLAPIHCASRTAYHRCHDCPDENACSVRLTMLDVREAIASVLDTRSIASMRQMAEAEESEKIAALHVS